MDADPALAERIRRLPAARMAQEEAKRQKHRQRADWLDVNVAVMDTVLEAKFAQHRSLRHLLRSTGSRELVEDSPVRVHNSGSSLTEALQNDRRSIGSGGSGVMVEAVTSSVRPSCVCGSNCKLVGGTDVNAFVLIPSR
jgi:NADAR domain